MVYSGRLVKYIYIFFFVTTERGVLTEKSGLQSEREQNIERKITLFFLGGGVFFPPFIFSKNGISWIKLNHSLTCMIKSENRASTESGSYPTLTPRLFYVIELHSHLYEMLSRMGYTSHVATVLAPRYIFAIFSSEVEEWTSISFFFSFKKNYINFLLQLASCAAPAWILLILLAYNATKSAPLRKFSATQHCGQTRRGMWLDWNVVLSQTSRNKGKKQGC